MIPTWAQRISDLLSADPAKTPAGLARACGIKGSSVSGWFGKGSKPTKMISGDNLVAAAAYLGVTPEYIMTGRNILRNGTTADHVAQSEETRLDPEMISIVHEALRKAYAKELGRPFDIEKDPARFVRAYQFRNRLSRDLPMADFVQFLAEGSLMEPSTSTGVALNGHSGAGKDGMPTHGDDQGGVAGGVQRKKGGFTSHKA